MNSGYVSFRTIAQLGTVVRRERELAGLTQIQLAERADVDRGWVVRLETGKLANPGLTGLFRLLAVLKLQLAITEALPHVQASSLRLEALVPDASLDEGADDS